MRHTDSEHRTTLLFLCTGNACRSQMAEAWCRHIWGERYQAMSAGIEAHGLDPRMLRVMAEAGVDLSHARSTRITGPGPAPPDYVITVCGNARERCPVYPARVRLLHQGFPDPPRLARGARTEAEALDHYRRVRDAIRAWISGLPSWLAARSP